MVITIEFGSIVVRWVGDELAILVDQGDRAWLVWRGRVLGRVKVGQC
jgi:hypothetical protein